MLAILTDEIKCNANNKKLLMHVNALNKLTFVRLFN